MCDDVQLNPARDGLLKPEPPVRAYRWSFCPEYLERPAQRWLRLRAERLQEAHRVPHDSVAGRRKSDKEKFAIACRLGKQTSLTLAELAERLQKGTKTHLAQLLHRQYQCEIA